MFGALYGQEKKNTERRYKEIDIFWAVCCNRFIFRCIVESVVCERREKINLMVCIFKVINLNKGDKFNEVWIFIEYFI